MNQKLRETLVFAALLALPFAGAFVIEWWAATLLCPLGVIGLVGLSDVVGPMGVRRGLSLVRPSRRDGLRRTRSG